MTKALAETIAAIATAPGRAGVGIVRVSGPDSLSIAEKLVQFTPKVRFAHYCPIRDGEGNILDEGIVLFFASPHSFTGEDVVEFQVHGGPIVLDMVLKAVLATGARLARPGEFSERAFLNDKLDLSQAEAIADLIQAESEQAARSALNSMQGAFSREIHTLQEQLTELRVYVESAIDFPEEEIDFLADGVVLDKLKAIIRQVEQVFLRAKQGSLLRDGMKVVIAGKPNAGKSSLLNALAEREAAIVTSIEGTTRDVLKEHILIDGMPLHIVDTAGLRENPDEVERIGIDRALNEVETADRILLLVDSTKEHSLRINDVWPAFLPFQPDIGKVTMIRNKIDESGEPPGYEQSDSERQVPIIRLSAREGTGLDVLRTHLKEVMGFASFTEGTFTARRRHLVSIEKALNYLRHGENQLVHYQAGELLAEDLRLAQSCLSEITGEFTPDDLLGEIFSSFCIGK